jgi:hypothetical protein
VALISSPELAGFDLLEQGPCFRSWLDAEFLGQNATAGLVLSQGRAALAAQGQQAHELLVGFLAPRLDLYGAVSEGQGLLILAGIQDGFFDD